MKKTVSLLVEREDLKSRSTEVDQKGRRKKLDFATEEKKERSERLVGMKQTERKRDKTPAEPPEGGGRWVCQIWTEEQKKDGASHSGLQRKLTAQLHQVREEPVRTDGRGEGITRLLVQRQQE